MSNTSTMSLPARDGAVSSATGFGAVLLACYRAWLRAFACGDATCGH